MQDWWRLGKERMGPTCIIFQLLIYVQLYQNKKFKKLKIYKGKYTFFTELVYFYF